MSPKPAENIGFDNTLVFSGKLPKISGFIYTIELSKPFNYDPSVGNLLLYIEATGTNAAPGGFADSTSGQTSRALGNQSFFDENYGLLTTFNSVPLPASAPLFGIALIALGGIGYAHRRGPVRKDQAA